MISSFTPGEIWPDDKGIHINAHGGGVLFHDGFYYWFGEHKIQGKAGNTAEVGVHVYRSRDLYNWENRGIALAVHDEPTSDIVRGCIIERPKVLYNALTRQFVMWFHLELKSQGYLAARCGVAVSETPEGPYRFLYSLRPDGGHWPLNVPQSQQSPVSHSDFLAAKLDGGSMPSHLCDQVFRRDFAAGQMSRDMTLFQDEDGAAYLVHASEENTTLHISGLTPDYLRTAGQYVRVFPGRLMEAPCLFKHAGKYWLFASGCTGWAPNAARSAVADSIFGPWTELGNPWQGSAQDQAVSFNSQPTFVLPVAGHPGQFIAMADRWTPENAIDGRYIWMPVEWDDGKPVLRWHAQWRLTPPQ